MLPNQQEDTDKYRTCSGGGNPLLGLRLHSWDSKCQKLIRIFHLFLQLLTSYHCQYCTASGDLSSTGGCVGRSCSGLKASSPACPGALQLYKPLGVVELCLHGSPAGFLFPAFAGGNSLGCRYLGMCLGTGFYFGVAVLKSEQCKREISLAVVLLT